jgi:hypothetical protein
MLHILLQVGRSTWYWMNNFKQQSLSAANSHSFRLNFLVSFLILSGHDGSLTNSYLLTIYDTSTSFNAK